MFMLWFNFILGSIFISFVFVSFLKVMYDGECKTKKKKNWTKDKIEPQHLHKSFVYHIVVLH